jgi:hypothetical protein
MQVTRDLEPGFAELSFQVIRRNTRAYALYREAADASSTLPTPIESGTANVAVELERPVSSRRPASID